MVAAGAGGCAVERVVVGRGGAVSSLLALLVHVHVVLVRFEKLVHGLFAEVGGGATVVIRKSGAWIEKNSG